jgi:hypothetical protein
MNHPKRKITAPTHDGHGARLHVTRGTKPPKLRFQAGTFFKLDGQLYELMYSFRIEDDPHEWHHHLEERNDLSDSGDVIHHALIGMGCGSKTPKVSYDIFRNESDAQTFFADIPKAGDGMTVSNRRLLKAEIVSSGLVTSTRCATTETP